MGTIEVNFHYGFDLRNATYNVKSPVKATLTSMSGSVGTYELFKIKHNGVYKTLPFDVNAGDNLEFFVKFPIDFYLIIDYVLI